MSLFEYRETPIEQRRVADLMHLVPDGITSVLDVGARDGYLSVRLAERIASVTALDLEKPTIEHDRIQCVEGNITALAFQDSSFDLVFCAEVLEHISALAEACSELSRVAKRYVLLGVPYKQDIRVGRTTCAACGHKNPPWGHVNCFDEHKLARHFPLWRVVKTSFVGTAERSTNALACLLMDLAGNPYGTYGQEEPCVKCGASLRCPPSRNLAQKALTKAAFFSRNVRIQFSMPGPLWIHVLMERSLK